MEQLKSFTFSQALEHLKLGKKITRTGWNGKGLWIELQRPDEHSKMTKPYIYMNIPKGSSNHFGDSQLELDRIPWLASQTDLLSDDWVVTGFTN